MYTPKPGKDGMRRYNRWAGNPGGHREDTSRCIVEVTPNTMGGFAHAQQCSRARGHGPDGLYCRQHDPDAVAARADASRKAYEAKWHARGAPERQRAAYRKALEEIAAGHNDPRAVAAKALQTD